MPNATAANPEQTPTLFKIVRMVNVGDRGFAQPFANMRYTIPPGGTAFVPWDAMIVWFGNPDAVDIGTRLRDRNDEYQRIRAKYGAYENEDKWEQQRPRIECFDAVSGERVWTVMDDPEGHRGGAAVNRVTSSNGLTVDELEAAMRQMSVQLEAMRTMQQSQMAMMAQAAGMNVPDATADGTNDDDPSVREGVAMGAPYIEQPPSPTQVVSDPADTLTSTGAAAMNDPLPDPTSRATRDEPRRPKTGPRAR